MQKIVASKEADRTMSKLKYNIGINSEYGNVDQHENHQWNVRSYTCAKQPKALVVYYINRTHSRPRALKR